MSNTSSNLFSDDLAGVKRKRRDYGQLGPDPFKPRSTNDPLDELEVGLDASKQDAVTACDKALEELDTIKQTFEKTSEVEPIEIPSDAIILAQPTVDSVLHALKDFVVYQEVSRQMTRLNSHQLLMKVEQDTSDVKRLVDRELAKVDLCKANFAETVSNLSKQLQCQKEMVAEARELQKRNEILKEENKELKLENELLQKQVAAGQSILQREKTNFTSKFASLCRSNEAIQEENQRLKSEEEALRQKLSSAQSALRQQTLKHNLDTQSLNSSIAALHEEARKVDLQSKSKDQDFKAEKNSLRQEIRRTSLNCEHLQFAQDEAAQDLVTAQIALTFTQETIKELEHVTSETSRSMQLAQETHVQEIQTLKSKARSREDDLRSQLTTIVESNKRQSQTIEEQQAHSEHVRKEHSRALSKANERTSGFRSLFIKEVGHKEALQCELNSALNQVADLQADLVRSEDSSSKLMSRLQERDIELAQLQLARDTSQEVCALTEALLKEQSSNISYLISLLELSEGEFDLSKVQTINKAVPQTFQFDFEASRCLRLFESFEIFETFETVSLVKSFASGQMPSFDEFCSVAHSISNSPSLTAVASFMLAILENEVESLNENPTDLQVCNLLRCLSLVRQTKLAEQIFSRLQPQIFGPCQISSLVAGLANWLLKCFQGQQAQLIIEIVAAAAHASLLLEHELYRFILEPRGVLLIAPALVSKDCTATLLRAKDIKSSFNAGVEELKITLTSKTGTELNLNFTGNKETWMKLYRHCAILKVAQKD